MIRNLRIIGNIEGVSYLILLFIAMPLKYAYDMPMAVKITGMAHGLLFIAYCLLLIAMRMKRFMETGLWHLSFYRDPHPVRHFRDRSETEITSRN